MRQKTKEHIKELKIDDVSCENKGFIDWESIDYAFVSNAPRIDNIVKKTRGNDKK